MKKTMKVIAVLIGWCLTLNICLAETVSERFITENEFINILSVCSKENAGTLNGSEAVLTREQAAKFIVTYLGYEAIAKKKSNNFQDVTSSQGEINLVSDLGLMSGVGAGKFNPKGQLTAEQAKVIVGRIQNKLSQAAGYKHACYAINSSSQSTWIKDYDGISFGWAQLEQTSDGKYTVSTNGSNNDFKVPSGFEAPLDLARANGVETYLMVYFMNQGDSAKNLFEDSTKRASVIKQIVALSQGVTKDGVVRDFDGITIDFEHFISSDIKASYNIFLQELSSALKGASKKLNVAVQPTTYFKGYDYKVIGEVSDHVIVMAHDYGTKTLTESEKAAGITETPLTPIDQVYGTLAEASQKIADKSKIVLQISFASLQWQSQNNIVLNSTAYTPAYDKIEQRLSILGTVKHFDNFYQSTYATYVENGVTNTIWFEDTSSVRAKTDLAKLMGITGVSYWRLGIIPAEFRLKS